MSTTPLNAIPSNAIPLNAIPLNAIPLKYKMNDIINKFLLAGDKFMKFISNNLGLLIVLVDHLLKTKKECKSLNKPEIQDIFTKMN